MSPDPMQYLFDVNTYRYCYNNSVNSTDSFGFGEIQNVGDALGGMVDNINKYLGVLSDMRLRGEMMQKTEDFENSLPAGNTRDLVLYIDPLTKRVVGVGFADEEAITKPGTVRVKVPVKPSTPPPSKPTTPSYTEGENILGPLLPKMGNKKL